jgi:hypothetical protein
MHGTLDISITTTHEVLRSRLDRAVAGHAVARRSRQDYPETDTFLASMSRHLAAASAALLPPVQHELPDGGARARDFVRQSRRLEVCLAQTKAKLYGEAHAIHRSWGAVWADVRTELDRTLEMERLLVDELLGTLSPDRADALAMQVYRAELRSPTRPHPFLPHRGLSGRLTRRLVHTVDHFWDATEGRMVPDPVHPRDHSHDGPFTHYLLADTDPDPEAEPREQ